MKQQVRSGYAAAIAICVLSYFAIAPGSHATTTLQDTMQQNKGAVVPAVRHAPGEDNSRLVLKARYLVYYKGVLAAELNDELKLTDQGGYVLQSTGNPNGVFAVFGTVHRTSRGTIDEERGLLLLQYREKRGRFYSWRVVDLDDDDILRFSYGKQQRTEAVPAPLFDFLAVAYVPFIKRQLPVLEQTWLTDGWRMKQYNFTASETSEMIATEHGEVEGWLYSRPEKNLQVWLAPDLDFLPVLVTGKSVRVELVSFESWL